MDSLGRGVDLLDAADHNLVLHFTWIQEHTAGMEIIRDGELIRTVSYLPSDNFNAVCRARLAPSQADRTIEATIRWFDARSLPFAWWTFHRDQPADLAERLTSAGFRLVERETAMSCDLATASTPDGSGVVIARATTHDDLDQFAAISAGGYHPADPCVATFYRRAAPALLSESSPCWFYLARQGDDAVGCLQATLSEPGVVGLYNLVTKVAARGQGVARTLMHAAMADTRAIGAHTAILQAAEPGANRYRALGFEPFGTISEYQLLRSTPGGTVP